MVEPNRIPRGDDVTIAAQIRAADVIGGFAGRGGAVVTGSAGRRDGIVIEPNERPVRFRMTILANIVRRDVIWRLADSGNG